jgi:hypothetical protein
MYRKKINIRPYLITFNIESKTKSERKDKHNKSAKKNRAKLLLSLFLMLYINDLKFKIEKDNIAISNSLKFISEGGNFKSIKGKSKIRT